MIVQVLTIADGFWTKLIGLMFRRSMDKSSGLIIKKCKAVHCCFMFMTIDVLFLSPDGQVVHIIKKMKPWTFSPYVRNAHAVLECECGTVERYGIHVGDRLFFD